MSNPLDWICLSLLPGLGPVAIRRLLERFTDPTTVLSLPYRELAATARVRVESQTWSELARYREQAQQVLEAVERCGGRVIGQGDDDYPARLRTLPDPPALLYGRGDMSLGAGRCVALVGSRAASSYGRRVARQFAEQLAAAGVTVVSGLAYGIDTEAHRGAVDMAGSTIAVLGNGLDLAYPAQNGGLQEAIGQRGLLLTEYPPGTKPEGFHFPARNRIIAGLVEAVVVVEAARKSGSLITAQLGLDFGRDVFAVPGQVDSCKSEGTHWLLRQGAQVAASVEDILESLSWGSGAMPGPGGQLDSTLLEPEARQLLTALDSYPRDRDALLDQCGLSCARGSELLLLLELDGQIEILPGNQVRRLGAS